MPRVSRELVNIRMSPNLIKELDDIVLDLKRSGHLSDFTRSDAIRILVAAGIRERAYNDPRTKWWLKLNDLDDRWVDQEELDRGDEPIVCPSVKKLDDKLPGPYDTKAEAEKNLERFIRSKKGYASGYGRERFDLVAISPQKGNVDEYIENIDNVGRSYGTRMMPLFFNFMTKPSTGV